MSTQMETNVVGRPPRQPSKKARDQQDFIDRLGSTDAKDLMATLRSLTPQQAHVLGLIARGLGNKQIAWRLSISEATVKAHVSALFAKLQVSNRTQAALLWVWSRAVASCWADPVGMRPDSGLPHMGGAELNTAFAAAADQLHARGEAA